MNILFGMANYQSHIFTPQDSAGVLQVYSVSITRDTIQLFLKFSKTDQTGERSTIVISILELSPDPLRPRTVNITISFQKLYMCSISKVPLRPLNLCSCTATL